VFVESPVICFRVDGVAAMLYKFLAQENYEKGIIKKPTVAALAKYCMEQYKDDFVAQKYKERAERMKGDKNHGL
jgi:hypothetical protein